MSKVLYPTSAGPVPTRLLSDYYPGDSSVTLRTLSDVPPAPNLITIYMDDVFVTLLYTSVDDEHTLSGLTYVEGDGTISFRESSYAVRTLNKYDIDAIQEYLTEHGQSLVQHDGLLEGLRTDLDNHEADKSNPHDTTKAQVGLGNADNTSDVNKPVSTAQRAAIDAVQENLDDHEANMSNPHSVTKAQVGLGNADNTSDADKPISTATQNALDSKAELGITATTAFYGDKGQAAYLHSQITDGNPHGVDKADVGLGNVDNTSDVNKPVSTAQRTAIDTVQGNLDDHEDDMNNPHGTTKAQVGLGNVDNTSDVNKPVSTAQKAYVDTVQSNLDDHEADKTNPHDVTKAQVGLGNVDNTSDVNKPVSTAQRTAIDLVQSNIDTRTIDGVTFDGSISHYAVCSTVANVAAKTVTLDGFSLGVGARVIVQFTNANRVANPTLNVSGTGAYPIMWKGANVDATALDASTVYELVYTGESWVIVGNISVKTKQPTIHGFLLDNADSNPNTRITYVGASTNLTSEERMALYTEHNRHCVVKAAQVVGLCDETDWSKFEDGTDSGVANGYALDGNFMIRHDTLWWRTSMYTPTVGLIEFTWDNPHDDSFVTAHAYADGTIRSELFTGVFESTKSTIGETSDCARSVYGTDDTYQPMNTLYYSDYYNYSQNTGTAEGLTGGDNTYNFENMMTYSMIVILLSWVYGTTDFQTNIAMGLVESNAGRPCGVGVSLTGGQTQGVPTGGEDARAYPAICGGVVNIYGNYTEMRSETVYYKGNLAMAVRGGDHLDIVGLTPSIFHDSIPETWHINTNVPPTETGYVSSVLFDKYCFFLPEHAGGSATTYFADTSTRSSNDVGGNYAVRMVCTGIGWMGGYQSGIFMTYLNSLSTEHSPSIATRLQCHGLTPIRP